MKKSSTIELKIDKLFDIETIAAITNPLLPWLANIWMGQGKNVPLLFRCPCYTVCHTAIAKQARHK